MIPAPVLIVSNGHGEDAIGAAIARYLLAHGTGVAAWPMVGQGHAYAGVCDTMGPANTLPSGGFATLGVRAFARDVAHGWFGVHARQASAARALAGRFRLHISVGDIVPLLVARLARTRTLFVGCAKSEYYGAIGRYNALERHLLRRQAIAAYARDQRTADALSAHGIPSAFAGNPVLDAVPAVPAPPHRVRGATLVVCLPGSRTGAEANARRILAHLRAGAARLAPVGTLQFAFAVTADFPADSLLGSPPDGWTRDGARLRCGHLLATVAPDALPLLLPHARAGIGLAGTANEQAVAAGVPLLTFPVDGPQGPAYQAMKARLMGASARRVRDDAGAVTAALLELLTNDTVRAAMVAEGRARMGRPGAAIAVAEHAMAWLRTPRPGAA